MRGLSRSRVTRIFFMLLLAATIDPGLLRTSNHQLEVQAGTADCTVPGNHTTIQLAVDDLACGLIGLTEINYLESVTISRSLSIEGSPSTVWGSLTIAGENTEVEVAEVGLGPTALFVDGFESGDASAWSGSLP